MMSDRKPLAFLFSIGFLFGPHLVGQEPTSICNPDQLAFFKGLKPKKGIHWVGGVRQAFRKEGYELAFRRDRIPRMIAGKDRIRLTKGFLFYVFLRLQEAKEIFLQDFLFRELLFSGKDPKMLPVQEWADQVFHFFLPDRGEYIRFLPQPHVSKKELEGFRNGFSRKEKFPLLRNPVILAKRRNYEFEAFLEYNDAPIFNDENSCLGVCKLFHGGLQRFSYQISSKDVRREDGFSFSRFPFLLMADLYPGYVASKYPILRGPEEFIFEMYQQGWPPSDIQPEVEALMLSCGTLLNRSRIRLFFRGFKKMGEEAKREVFERENIRKWFQLERSSFSGFLSNNEFHESFVFPEFSTEHLIFTVKKSEGMEVKKDLSLPSFPSLPSKIHQMFFQSVLGVSPFLTSPILQAKEGFSKLLKSSSSSMDTIPIEWMKRKGDPFVQEALKTIRIGAKEIRKIYHSDFYQGNAYHFSLASRNFPISISHKNPLTWMKTSDVDLLEEDELFFGLEGSGASSLEILFKNYLTICEKVESEPSSVPTWLFFFAISFLPDSNPFDFYDQDFPYGTLPYRMGRLPVQEDPEQEWWIVDSGAIAYRSVGKTLVLDSAFFLWNQKRKKAYPLFTK